MTQCEPLNILRIREVYKFEVYYEFKKKTIKIF